MTGTAAAIAFAAPYLAAVPSRGDEEHPSSEPETTLEIDLGEPSEYAETMFDYWLEHRDYQARTNTGLRPTTLCDEAYEHIYTRARLGHHRLRPDFIHGTLIQAFDSETKRKRAAAFDKAWKHIEMLMSVTLRRPRR